MPAPATLQKLIAIAARKVSRLEAAYRRASANAQRTHYSPDECARMVCESNLEHARGHLNALRMQARREQRDNKLLAIQGGNHESTETLKN